VTANWLRRVWHLVNRSRRERELVREMDEHRALMSDGSRFGNTHRLIEQSRDAWGWNWLDDATQDFRQGMRALKRSPVFTITAILILSFAIGLNLTVFQMANVALLRGPDVPRPEALARLHRHGTSPRSNNEAVPYVAAVTIARADTALAAVMIEANAAVVWGEASSVIDASFVSANWFSQLGYTPLLGRAFTPQIDSDVQAQPAVIASYRFWKDSLGGDASVIGTAIRVNNQPVTVIGVMPERFPELDLDASAVWLPINQRDYYFPNSTFLTDWGTNNIAMYGRFKDGMSQADVRESVRGVVASLHRERPEYFDADEWLEPAMATTNFTEPAERLGFIGVASTIGLLTLMVLVVAATNLGNLVMSRATSRVRELGVRVALGAGRSRIVRQLAIEAMPLGVSGAAGGLVVAMWASNTIAAVGEAPPYLEFTPDRVAIGLSGVLAAFALAIVGALPAWKISKQDLTDAIKDGGQQISMRLDRARVRSVMLAAQVGGSCLILIVSAMMVRSLQNALTANVGFAYEQSAILQAGLSAVGLKGEAARSYWLSVKERVAASPETEAAALAVSAPFVGRGRSPAYREAPALRVTPNRIDAEYFSVLKIPLVAGRTFRTGDDPATTVIISRALAQAMYGTTDVVGRAFPASEPHDTIVGVAGDTSSVRPGDKGSADVYRPLSVNDFDRVILLARARNSATTLLPVLRQAALTDPRVFAAARLLRDDFDRGMSSVKIASIIGASIGVLTLVLACIGIFGVVSYGVTLRTKEVGIHLALGASRRSILKVITRPVLSPFSIGITLGTAAALPVGIALAQSPLQLAFADPASYAGALLMLLSAAVSAALLPAFRALGKDPIQALRRE
jgi:predicted permease